MTARTLTGKAAGTLLLVLALSCAWLTASAKTPSAGDAAGAARSMLNDTARQRMLTQRMVKAWCLIGLNNRNSNAREQLFSAIEQFEEQLEILGVLAQTHTSLAVAVKQMRASWQPFEAIISAPVRRTEVDALLQLDKSLLDATEQVVQQVAALSKSPYSRLVNLAGRQRMYSQRLLKTYMLLAWGIPNPHISEEFVAAWNSFEETLMALHGLAENTPQLRQALVDTDEQWLWMKSALSLTSSEQFYPDIVDDAGEKILVNLEQVTKLYEQMSLADERP